MADVQIQDRAEQAVLGCCLRDPATISDASLFLRPDDFRQYPHILIFRSLQHLTTSGQVVTLVGVAEYLHHKHPGDVRLEYLAEIYDTACTTYTLTHHCRVVRDAAIFRRLEVTASQIAESARSPKGPAVEVLEDAERAIMAISQVGLSGGAKHIREVMAEVSDRIDARASSGRPFCGLPTGIEHLDSLTAGLQGGELVILAARPSVGKTALALALARAVAERGTGVFFASLEQSRCELAERMLCAHSGVSAQDVRLGRLSRQDFEALVTSRDVLIQLPFHVDDASSQSVIRIGANARRLKAKHHVGLVVVDYLQLIEPSSRREPRHEQVGGISRSLKALARELGLPLIALAQLNRGVEDRAGQRPRLADLRESGSIEADADTVILLHRPEVAPTQADVRIDLIIAKQRNGPTGELSLQFHRDRMAFSAWVDPPFNR